MENGFSKLNKKLHPSIQDAISAVSPTLQDTINKVIKKPDLSDVVSDAQEQLSNENKRIKQNQLYQISMITMKNI